MSKLTFILTPALAAALSIHASAATVNLSASADSTVWYRVGQWDNLLSGSYDQVDFYSFSDGSAISAFGYFQFDLSSLGGGPTISIDSVTLTLTQVATNPDYEGIGSHSTRNDALTTDRVQLYGLADVAGNTPQNWTEGLSYAQTGGEMNLSVEANASKAADPFNVAGGRAVDFSTLDSVSSGVVTLTGGSVASFVQSRYNDDGFVTFLLDFNASGRGAAVYSSEATSGQPVLSITYSVVPEPSAALLGGLGLIGLLRRRRG
ncbi:MAG: PEP-CTERM sorting domain-containing protein [Akkermansiaceae bacterium]|nr:PEP-CTERM sorting domain-containing protein [Akkermansiaceae bacterium]MCP5542837.1 PEP-CTERM sorting domain-containing protein [Akkermansiaceae bacterium]MCP5547105.1 PEP-CTERM sorting domain-containing protein [Akkermansiaceae bacterium]